MTRRGFISAGTWCVDLNKSIAMWPSEDTSNEVLAIDRQGGGAGCNMALDLKRLDPAMPVQAMGVIGADDNGRFLLERCAQFGIDAGSLVSLPGEATMAVDAFNVSQTGRRTHFFFQGAGAKMSPEHFDFSATTARIFHCGLPGAHAKMDALKSGGNGWAELLKAAKAAGLQTNLELMTIARDILAAAAAPCLPYLDTLIVNDYEIGAIAGIETRTGGQTDAAAIKRAVAGLFERGPMSLIAAHFPEGVILGDRQGRILSIGSLAVPEREIAGVNGAGDAFAAGMLYGLHERHDLEACARLGHACSAASMRAVSTSAGVVSVGECLALAQGWGWRRDP